MATQYYHCDNPALHSVLKLNCPCYKKHRVMSPTTGQIPEIKSEDGILQQSRFESTKDPYQKEMMKMRALRPAQIEKQKKQEQNIKFTPDWTGWIRYIWSNKNFNGGQVGPFKMNVEYSDNIAGYQISDTFSKRHPNIVTDSQGLCANLPQKIKPGNTSLHNGASVSLSFPNPVRAVQFAILSPTIGPNRKDAFRVFCNDTKLEEGEYYHGTGTVISGGTFLAIKRTADNIGQGDILIKVNRPNLKIKNIKIEFSNLDNEPIGGRLALTDILIK